MSELAEFIDRISSLSFFEVWASIHGSLAMLALALFGGAITLSYSLDKFARAYQWLRNTLYWLAGTVVALDALGLFIYRPYRESVPDSPRSILKASEETSWLHGVVFEHKEMLAFAPMVMLITALMIVIYEGKSLKNNPVMKNAVRYLLITSLVFVLVVAAEAVLVTKAAPLK